METSGGIALLEEVCHQVWPLRICIPHHLALCHFLYVVEDGISQCPILVTCCDGSLFPFSSHAFPVHLGTKSKLMVKETLTALVCFPLSHPPGPSKHHTGLLDDV